MSRLGRGRETLLKLDLVVVFGLVVVEWCSSGVGRQLLSISLVSMGFVGWWNTGVFVVGRVMGAVVCSGV